MSVYTENPERTIVTKLELKRLRAELVRDEEGNEDFFAFQARCIRKFGVAAGVFVRQLVFWTGKGADPSGWIYKTRDELYEEVGLSQRQQNKARKILKAKGVIEEDLRTVPPNHQYRAMHYRVRFDELADALNEDAEEVWDGISEPEVRDGNSGPDPRDGNSVSDPWDGISEPEVWDGNSGSEVRDGNSVPATENTTGEHYRRTTSENSSENSFRESSFQEAAGAENRAAPPPQINKSGKSNEEEDSTTSFPGQPEGESKMVTEVRRLLEKGRHAPVALKHYRAGRIGVEAVAEFVSQDATGSDAAAETLLPAVRAVLEEVGVA